MRAAEVSTIVDEQLDLQRPNEQADTGALGGAPDHAHHICSRDQQPGVGSPVDVRPAVLQSSPLATAHMQVAAHNPRPAGRPARRSLPFA
jgi:hypothetical protein